MSFHARSLYVTSYICKQIERLIYAFNFQKCSHIFMMQGRDHVIYIYRINKMLMTTCMWEIMSLSMRDSFDIIVSLENGFFYLIFFFFCLSKHTNNTLHNRSHTNDTLKNTYYINGSDVVCCEEQTWRTSLICFSTFRCSSHIPL